MKSIYVIFFALLSIPLGNQHLSKSHLKQLNYVPNMPQYSMIPTNGLGNQAPEDWILPFFSTPISKRSEMMFL